MTNATGIAPRVLISATGTQGFLLWLKERQPYLYRKIEKQIPARQLSGLAGGDPLLLTAATTPTSSSVSDVLKNLVLGAGQVLLTKAQLQAQQKIIDLQLERARAGLPPADIDPTQYGLPSPSVQLGLDPSTKQLLLVGGGIATALILGSLLFGGRRRRRR